MAVKLSQGGRFSITTQAPYVHELGIGLGWEKRSGHSQFDLDVAVAMLNKNKQLPSKEHFVFYGNLISADQSIQHSGDERSGATRGDDELIVVHLAEIADDIQDILFLVSIFDGKLKRQHFGQLMNAYIRVFNLNDGMELIRYDLDEELKFQTSGEFARLSRKNKEWSFVATGKGEYGGLKELRAMYS
ncbi:MAG: TerD family protein [Flammeovirgaceae bacterium]